MATTTATANVDVTVDTTPIEEVMRILARHFTACADELAARRGERED